MTMHTFIRLGLLSTFPFISALTVSAAACCAPGSQATSKAPAMACCVERPAGGEGCCAAGAGEGAQVEATANAMGVPVLDAYTRLSEAMVADDLEATRATARALIDEAIEAGQATVATLAGELAAAADFSQARERLVPLSQEIIRLAEDTDGYFVMSCPMVRNGEWLQSDREVRNPYMGQSMVRCGVVRRSTGS